MPVYPIMAPAEGDSPLILALAPAPGKTLLPAFPGHPGVPAAASWAGHSIALIPSARAAEGLRYLEMQLQCLVGSQHTPAGEGLIPRGNPQDTNAAPAQVLPEFLVPPRPPQCHTTCFKCFAAKSRAAPVLTNHLFDLGWYHRRKSSFLPLAQHVLPVNLCILFCWFFFYKDS